MLLLHLRLLLAALEVANDNDVVYRDAAPGAPANVVEVQMV
jgi:hypothetical protein